MWSGMDGEDFLQIDRSPPQQVYSTLAATGPLGATGPLSVHVFQDEIPRNDFHSTGNRLSTSPYFSQTIDFDGSNLMLYEDQPYTTVTDTSSQTSSPCLDFLAVPPTISDSISSSPTWLNPLTPNTQQFAYDSICQSPARPEALMGEDIFFPRWFEPKLPHTSNGHYPSQALTEQPDFDGSEGDLDLVLETIKASDQGPPLKAMEKEKYAGQEETPMSGRGELGLPPYNHHEGELSPCSQLQGQLGRELGTSRTASIIDTEPVNQGAFAKSSISMLIRDQEKQTGSSPEMTLAHPYQCSWSRNRGQADQKATVKSLAPVAAQVKKKRGRPQKYPYHPKRGETEEETRSKDAQTRSRKRKQNRLAVQRSAVQALHDAINTHLPRVEDGNLCQRLMVLGGLLVAHISFQPNSSCWKAKNEGKVPRKNASYKDDPEKQTEARTEQNRLSQQNYRDRAKQEEEKFNEILVEIKDLRTLNSQDRSMVDSILSKYDETLNPSSSNSE